MDELPLPILSDILSRLPLESLDSLVRYRSVCKRWREVIHDSHFFRNSLPRLKQPVLLCLKEDKICLLQIHEDAPTKMIQIGKFPALKKYRLRGACNGFLFFAHITNVQCKPKLLINPLTKEIWIWPSTPDLLPDTSVYGFGFDSSIKTYKMVQINAIDYHGETRTWTMKARVYDFEKRSWRTCKAPPPFHTHRPDYNLPFAFGPCPIFVCASGAVNWILDRFSSSGFDGREILSFDLTEEEFSLIPIPNVSLRWGYAMEMPMHGLEGSLALVDYPNDGHIDVWVLEDRARREWTRKYRIRTPWAACTCSVVGPYGSDKLILRHWRDGELMTYDVNKDQFAKCGAEEGRAARASTGVPTSLFCATLSLHSL